MEAEAIDPKALEAYKKAFKLDVLRQEWDREEKKILANPYTICDLLSNPNPKKFIDLIKGEVPDASAKWITKLQKMQYAFRDWFEAQGGAKSDMVNAFTEMVACPNRAPWAAWSGKAYRGVGRSPSVVSKYDFTGEVKKIDGSVWLVAKGSYKSHYGAQSWSDEWGTAQDFAVDNTNRVCCPIAVVFEVNLKRSDTLLSPDVVKKISGYGISEREVIRVGNAPIPVTIYVSATTIEEAISQKLEKSDGLGNKARKKVYDRAVALFGVKCADAFAKTKEFKDLVKDLT